MNAEGVPCPAARDPARNRHRTGQGWSSGMVLSILANPRYTGHQVWNRQSNAEQLLDVHNVGLGTRTVMRWNPGEQWVYSQQQVHPAIVSREEFHAAQTTRAVRGRPRRYLLRGLLRCGLCGQVMEGVWNNGRANYRCTARSAPEHLVDGKIRNVYIREDAVTAHLGALLIRATAPPGIPFDQVDIPRDAAAQVAACHAAGLRLDYDPLKRALSADTAKEQIMLWL